MTGKKYTDAGDLFKKTSSGDDIPEKKKIEEPTQKEMDEVCTPDLSPDTFTIADKTFRFKLSNIKTQKRMAYALDSINILMDKIDIRKLFDKIRKTFKGYEAENKPEEQKDAYLDVLELAKQVNVVGYQALQRGFSHYGAIQRYPTVNLPGTTLGSFALNDTAIMLIEIKGQTQNLGQKQSGMLTQTSVVSIYEILIALADDTIYDVDPSLYEEILPSANRMSDPSQRDEEF